MLQQFHKPTSIKEALALKRQFGAGAVYFSGGTYLNSLSCPGSPAQGVSLEGLDLDRVEARGGALAIGALCSLQTLIDNRKVPAALRDAAAQVVSRNVRNAATLGGHVALHQPDSDIVPMLVALEATVALAGAAKRSLPVLDYVCSKHSGTALITHILLPRTARRRRAACCNFRTSASARSLVSAAISISPGPASVLHDPIIAVGGLGRHTLRLSAVEAALHGATWPEPGVLEAMVRRAVRPAADHLGSIAFKKHEAGAVVALAFEKARKGREPAVRREEAGA